MRIKGKKVLVTGACGFIGSHLVERLLEEGCDVRAFVFYNSFNSWGWLDSLPKEKLGHIDIYAGDIRDARGVKEAVRNIDVIFHLAALIGIPFSYRCPDSYVDTNIKGTLNVLQAAKESGADRIIVTSTSEVYGTARYAPIDEGHPLQAQSPYSASKIGADKIAESFHLSFGLPAVIARPFNTYGPRQSARAIIPTVISQALSGSGRIKLGNLKPTRDMNYVADVCDGFVSIAGSEKVIGKTVNICSGGEISMRDLAETILQLTGSEAVIIEERRRFRPEDSEVDRLVGSNSNIHRLTGWRPRYALRDGLEKTIEWFRDGKNLNAYKGGMYNV